MKYIFVLFILISSLSYSQKGKEIYSKSVFKYDSIHIHWVPSTTGIYQTLFENDILIELIPWNTNQKPNDSDFEFHPLMEKVIIPSRKKMLELDSSKFSVDAMLLMNGILYSEDTLASKMIYANAMLMSSINRRLSKELGLYFSLKTKFQSNYFAYNIKVKEQSMEIGLNKLIEVEEFIQFDSLKYQHDLGEVTLIWNELDLRTYYSAYDVERSLDGKSFQRINKNPLIHFVTDHEQQNRPAMFVDKQVKKGQTYSYRLKAIDHLGFYSGVSNKVKVEIPRPIEGRVLIDTIFFQKSLLINGRLLANKDELKFVKSVQLFYSNEITSNYKLVGRKKINELDFNLTYKSEVDLNRGYLKLAAISKTSDTLWSEPKYFFFRDSIPPDNVTGIQGQIDTVGRVVLKWLAVEDDLEGYRIFRANSLKEEYVEISNVLKTDTFYLDSISLNNLTRNIYYKIVAVDRNFNNSKFSDPVKIIKPDLIPPVPSYIASTSISAEGVFLSWVPSGSIDVLSIWVQKRDSIRFQNVYKTDKDTFFIDPNVINGNSYKYRLMTIDSSGNMSFSKEIIVAYELGYRKSIQKLTYKVDRKQNYIDLEWKNPSNVYSIQLYLAKNEHPFYLVQTLFDNQEGYRFTKLQINNVYRFKMQITHQDGALSKMSEELEIEF